MVYRPICYQKGASGWQHPKFRVRPGLIRHAQTNNNYYKNFDSYINLKAKYSITFHCLNLEPMLAIP